VIEKSAELKNGIIHGECQYYDEEGEILASTTFNEGIMEGPAKKYYRSEALFSEETYQKGLLHGKSLFFFEDGSVKAELYYTHGKLTDSVKLYYFGGRLKREIHFKDGLQHGSEKYWDKQGNLLFAAEYKNGKPFGEVLEYYPNGKIQRRTIFDESKRISQQEFDENGNEIHVKEEPPAHPLNEYLWEMEKLGRAFGDEKLRLFF